MIEVYQTLLYDVYGSAFSADKIVAAAQRQFDCYAEGTCTFNVTESHTSTRRKLQTSFVAFSVLRRVGEGELLLPPSLNETLLSLEMGQSGFGLSVVGSTESTQAVITTTNSGGSYEADIVTSGFLSSERLAEATSAALGVDASLVTAATPTAVYPPSPPPHPPVLLPEEPPPASTQSYSEVTWIAAAVALTLSVCLLLAALFVCAFWDSADEKWWGKVNMAVVPMRNEHKIPPSLPPLRRVRPNLDRFTFESLRSKQ